MTNSIPALDQLVSVQYYLHGPNTEEGYEENRVFQKGRGVGLGGVILNGLKARSDPATPKVLGQYKEVVVQPIPAGKSSDVLEAFLSEARSKRSAENIKTLRRIRLGQQIFHMNPREASAMVALVAASGRILALKAAFRATYRGSPPLTITEPDVRKRSSAAELTRLSRALCVSTVNLEDLIKRSNFFMLNAIHKFFRGVRHSRSGDGVVRKYFKAYDTLLDKEAIFMRQCGREANPGKQREALLKKLKESDFILPRLFALYDVMISTSTAIPDIKPAVNIVTMKL